MFNLTTTNETLDTSLNWLLTQMGNWSFLDAAERREFLEKHNGPALLGHREVITWLYPTLVILGIPANFLTCFVILWKGYLRSPSNYFLFSLAITDIITLAVGKKKSLFAGEDLPIHRRL